MPANDSKNLLGFWIYLMTDCVLFASLFATFAVLRGGTYGGPTGQDLFNLPYILVETLALLTSSFTCGMSLLAARRRDKQQVLIWLVITALLGLVFLTLELTEFRHLAAEGDSWRRSGFLSSYFTLVGTHGLHITIGLLWLAGLWIKFQFKGITDAGLRKLTMFSLFWHFLDLVWIFIFTIVYLFGVIPV
ncbi:MAG TPA: cytochrome o ubiquinol oxidase subunit III [Candidatus Saccharimonadales bacterium]|nr:cytochrome o ubiquinol oxidase subunit III [Candidatus Saccharimonadales bacterium]